MDTEKCRVLLTVLHERSLSAAAEALGYTPSGISRLVDSLERETGFPLLHRGRGGVSATRACQELLPLMRRMAELDEQYQQLAHRIQGLDVGRVVARHQLRRLLPVAVGGHCRVPSRLSRHPGGAAGGQLYPTGRAGGSPAGGLLSHQPAAGAARMGAAEGRPADGHSPPYPPAGGGGPLPRGAAAAGALHRVSAGSGDR